MYSLSGGRRLARQRALLRPDTYEPFEQRQTMLAESGEGKAVDQGKTLVNLPRTRLRAGRACPKGWRACGKAGRDNKEMKFTALLHHLTVDLLRKAFTLSRGRPHLEWTGSTWQEYEDGLEDRLTDLHARVHQGAYRATPSRWCT